MKENFEERIRRIRNAAEDITAVVDELGEGEDLQPANDEFREVLDRIVSIGRARDVGMAPWLAGLTQVDDLGPMGRAMFISMAALAALAEMPSAALEAAQNLLNQLPQNASQYRKVGLILVAEASACEEGEAIIRSFLDDEALYVSCEASLALERMMIA
jgi:hypothetical protein